MIRVELNKIIEWSAERQRKMSKKKKQRLSKKHIKVQEYELVK